MSLSNIDKGLIVDDFDCGVQVDWIHSIGCFAHFLLINDCVTVTKVVFPVPDIPMTKRHMQLVLGYS